jgi:hypothetical protein
LITPLKKKGGGWSMEGREGTFVPEAQKADALVGHGGLAGAV